MKEDSIIKIEQLKEKKVEIVKDINPATDPEREIIEKEHRQNERKAYMQLIVIFASWIVLIILFGRNQNKPLPKPKIVTPPPNTINSKALNTQPKANVPNKTPPQNPSPTQQGQNKQVKPPNVIPQNQISKKSSNSKK